MYGYTYGYRYVAGLSVAMIAGLVLGIAGAIVLLLLFLPAAKRNKLSPFLKKAHDFLNFKIYWLGYILKILYIIANVTIVCVGLYMLFVNFLSGLLMLVFGPIVLRLVHESIFLLFSIQDGLAEINKKLGNIKLPEPEPEPEQQLPNNICRNCKNELPEGSLFCPVCGAKRE